MSDLLKDELKNIVCAYWGKTQRPILLSLLGERLTPQALQDRKEIGTTLGAFMSAEMPETLRVLRIPAHGTGVVPKPDADNFTDEELIAAVPAPRPDGIIPAGTSSHVISKDIWVLFRYGLKLGERAFVEVPPSGAVSVYRVGQDATPKANWLSVEENDLPKPEPSSDGASPMDTGNSIRAWAAKHGIDLDRIQTLRSSPINKDGYLAQDSGILLVRLLNGLSVLEMTELSRIMIPADVVVSLLRRNIDK